MAILKKLFETVLDHDEYPREIIPTIVVDHNRSGIIVKFYPETIRKTKSALKFVGDVDADFILDIIKERITSSEKLAIKKVNLDKFRKVVTYGKKDIDDDG